MTRRKSRKRINRQDWLGFGKVLRERRRELYGEESRLASKALGVKHGTYLQWEGGWQRPHVKWRPLVGIFMGWMKDAEDKEGRMYTLAFFESPAARTSPELREQVKKEKRMRKLFRKNRKVEKEVLRDDF